MAKLETAHLENCIVYNLPGRDWFYLLGPENSGAKNLCFGLADFPGGTLAGFHTHEAEEEILYVISGTGAIITEEEEIRFEPGVAVLIPQGVPHRIRADGKETLRVVTVFSPPVVPGAYDRDKDKA